MKQQSKHIKRHCCLVVGMAPATSRRVVEIVRMWMSEWQSMENLDHLKNIKINIKEWTWKTQMIWNVPELQEVNQSEAVL
jgi:hypothetical protein